MELTIEQALQQGVAAHKEGKLADAERLYRAILQSQPLHPDVNHNLGILAVSVNKADLALPLFKTALEANSKVEQFWLSYIDTLIKEKQFDNAKQVLEQGKNQGVAGEKLNALESQLASIVQSENANNVIPSQQQLTRLLDYYQAGQHSDAEKVAVSITEQFPKHPLAWKVLGVIFTQTGRKVAAANANQVAVELSPQDAEAQCNLAVTLQELGRLDEAEVSYKQAIALKTDYAEAHYNLGMMLKELGRLDEAAASYTQVVALKPDYAEAHNSLLTCLYSLDNRSLFIDQLDYLINQGKVSSLIGSLTCRSALKYGLQRSNIFCEDPLKYILRTDLNTQYDFKEIFVKKARFILDEKKLLNRKQPLLIEGYQTFGNLFDIENDFTEKIQKTIRLEIEKYRLNFKDSEEGFIKKWPTEYVLNGWLISMKSGGELLPHIHEEGWLSGAIYINVPPKSKNDSGSLVVSLGEEKDATNTRINVSKIINVVTGNLVLFPGSLTHHTMPFESEEERIVLAFDVIAK